MLPCIPDKPITDKKDGTYENQVFIGMKGDWKFDLKLTDAVKFGLFTWTSLESTKSGSIHSSDFFARVSHANGTTMLFLNNTFLQNPSRF